MTLEKYKGSIPDFLETIKNASKFQVHDTLPDDTRYAAL